MSLAGAAVVALATSWTQVAPSEQASLARTPDGKVHVAWAQDGALFHTEPGAGTTATIASGGPDARPALLAGPDGLHALWGSVAAFSGDDGLSWQPGTSGASGAVSAVMLPGGGILQAWTEGDRVRVGPSDHGAGADPALTVGAAAWTTAEGVRVQTIREDGAPDGEASTMPDGAGRPSIVARDGEVFVAAGPAVWRVGSRSTLPLEGAVLSTLSADARGRVWAAWSDDSRVYAARSNRDVSEFGAPVDLGALSASSLAVNATNSAAHVLAAANGVSYLRRTLPGLSLAERHRREIFTFSVTDAGDPVRGAVVKVGGRSGKTDRNGRVTLRVSDRKLRVTATLKGYEKARLTLK